MKKIFSIVIIVVFPIVAFAQRGIPRTDNVSVSSTIVTKTHHKRSIKKNDAKIGYQHIAEISFWGMESIRLGLDYIGGWRFNNWLFMGAGIGWHHEFNSEHPNYKMNMDDELYWIGRGSYSISGDELESDLTGIGSDIYQPFSLNTFAIPVYAHIRTYLSRTRIAPFLSLSLGERFAPKDNGIYFDFSTGLDCLIKSQYHMFVSVGFWASKYRDTRIIDEFDPDLSIDYNYDVELTTFKPYESCDWDCDEDYIEYGHDHIVFSNFFKNKITKMGFSVKLGFSF